MKINRITNVAIFIALFFIASNIIMPLNFFGIPVTWQTLIIYLIPFFLSYKEITLWFITLLLVCLIGFPIMNGFQGGLGVLVGASAGFIYSWIFVMLLIKWYINIVNNQIFLFLGMLVSAIVGLVIGTIYLSIYTNEILYEMVFTFIPIEILKIILVLLLIKKIPSNLKC